MSSSNSEKSVRHFPFMRIIWKRLGYIILAAIITAGVGLAYSTYLVKPKYTASTALILKMKSSDVGVSGSQTTTEITLAKYYLPTVADIVVSPAAIKRANNLYTGEGKVASSAVSVTYGEESLIFSLAYTDVSEEKASAKLNALIAGVKELLSSNDAQQGQTYIKARNVGITSTQNKNTIQVDSGQVKYTVISGVVGAVVFTMIIFLLYKSNNTVTSKSEFEELTGVDMLSMIEDRK